MINRKLKLGLAIFLVGSIMIVGTACSQKNNSNKSETSNNTTSEKPTETSNENTSEEKDEQENTQDNKQENTQKNTDYAKEYLKVIENVKKESSDEEIKCSLISFNNDNTPDLLIDAPGYWINLYIYANGKMHNPAKNLPYGTNGNTGYNYQEGKGVISNKSTDLNGHISIQTYLLLNKNNALDDLSIVEQGADVEKNDSDYAEVQDYLSKNKGYKFNDRKINKKEYNDVIKKFGINNNNLKELTGQSSIDEIKKQLTTASKK